MPRVLRDAFLGVKVPSALLARVDEYAEPGDRSRLVRRAIERYLTELERIDAPKNGRLIEHEEAS